jgi:TonB family protein
MFRRRPRLATIALALIALSGPGVTWAQDGARRDPPAPAPAPSGVVTRAPVLLQAVAPEYPPAALAAGRQAQVKVRIHIDDAGLVSRVEVLAPVGDGFDEAAVAAAEQYVFEPAEIDGKPAAIAVETTIHFVIEVSEAPPPPPPPDPGDAAAPDAPPGHAGDPRQPVTLAGEVVERGTRRRLPGVIVSIVELGLDAVSDLDGRFSFHGVGAGTWQILAVDDRYQRLQRTVAIGAGEAVEVRLWMHPIGGNPYETIIEGEHERLEVTRRTLERRQLTTVPGTFGDPLRVVQALPGLARAPYALGLLLVRGSNPDDTGVYVDGHRVPLLFHFLGGPSFLNAELVESIDLYPSGFPARFGRIHGGVVAIESRPSKSDGVHGSADVDLLDAGGYLRAPLGKRASFAVAGRRSYLDSFLGYFLPEQAPGAQLVVVPVYWDWQVRGDLDLGAQGRVSTFAFASADRLDVLQRNPAQEVDLGLNTAIDFVRVIASYRRPLGKQLSLTISPAWGRDSITFASGSSDRRAPYLSAEIVQRTLSYRARVTGPLRARVLLDAGVDLESRVTDYDALVPDDSDIPMSSGIDVPPEAIRASAESIGAAAHADVAIDVGRLRLIPGLRLDTFLLSGQARASLDPRLTGRWRLDEELSVKGFLGRFTQPPQPETADSRFGNPAIGLEHALHVGAGAEWRPDRLWLIDVEAYYIDRRDLVAFTNRTIVNPDGTATRPLWVNEGTGSTYGLEVMIKREISDRVYGWLAYTFSRSKRDVPFFGRSVTPFDQTHVGNAVASWRVGAGWELGARWRFATGRPITPIVEGTYDADEGGYDPVRGPWLSDRLPFFNQVDARAEKTWLFDTWMLGLYLDVQNLLATDNVEALEYDYRFRERAAIGGVPFLPTLGIRGQW